MVQSQTEKPKYFNYENDYNKGCVWVFKTTNVEGVFKVCCKETSTLIEYAESEIVAKKW